MIMDEINLDMWKLAKRDGLTKPGLSQLIEAAKFHGMGPVEITVQVDDTIQARIKGKGSPCLTFSIGVNNVLVTVTATKPDRHATGYRQLMEGMDA